MHLPCTHSSKEFARIFTEIRKFVIAAKMLLCYTLLSNSLIIQNLFILQTYQLVLVVFWLFQLLFHLANLSVQYEKFWQFDQL